MIRKIMIKVEEDEHWWLKLIAHRRRTTMQAIIHQMVKDVVQSERDSLNKPEE